MANILGRDSGVVPAIVHGSVTSATDVTAIHHFAPIGCATIFAIANACIGLAILPMRRDIADPTNRRHFPLGTGCTSEVTQTRLIGELFLLEPRVFAAANVTGVQTAVRVVRWASILSTRSQMRTASGRQQARNTLVVAYSLSCSGVTAVALQASVVDRRIVRGFVVTSYNPSKKGKFGYQLTSFAPYVRETLISECLVELCPCRSSGIPGSANITEICPSGLIHRKLLVDCAIRAGSHLDAHRA